MDATTTFVAFLDIAAGDIGTCPVTAHSDHRRAQNPVLCNLKKGHEGLHFDAVDRLVFDVAAVVAGFTFDRPRVADIANGTERFIATRKRLLDAGLDGEDANAYAAVLMDREQ